MGERRRRRLFRREQAPAETSVIDLRGGQPPPRTVPALPDLDSKALHAQLVARRRAELARAEAQRELAELRRRHWSADRIFEESRLGVDWWEHPLADPHATLGLLPGDSFAAASEARRAIAKGVHPDLVPDGDDVSYRQMVAVNGAHDRLRRAIGPLPKERASRPRSQWSMALGQGAATAGGATTG